MLVGLLLNSTHQICVFCLYLPIGRHEDVWFLKFVKGVFIHTDNKQSLKDKHATIFSQLVRVNSHREKI